MIEGSKPTAVEAEILARLNALGVVLVNPKRWADMVAQQRETPVVPMPGVHPRRKLTAAQRRSITQRTGAVVALESLEGIVTGHYNDDIVYVDFGSGPTGVAVESLTFIATRAPKEA